MTVILKLEPLTREAFRPFGDVIDTDSAANFPINEGYATRFDDLAHIDAETDDGEPTISIFRGNPRAFPLIVTQMERHPLGSQAFYPLIDRPWLVIVSEGEACPTPRTLRAFRASGRQGINYRRNCWHHSLLVTEPASEFLIIDRKGHGTNLEIVHFAENERAVVEMQM